MKIMGTSFKRFHACTTALSASNPAAGYCWPMPPLETHGHLCASLVSLLWGHCSFLLGPCALKVLFVPFHSLFPQSCVSSGGSMVGLMATSSKRAYAVAGSTALRAPDLQQSTARTSVLPQEMLRHSSVLVSVGSVGPGAHKVCLSPLRISGGCGV